MSPLAFTLAIALSTSLGFVLCLALFYFFASRIEKLQKQNTRTTEIPSHPAGTPPLQVTIPINLRWTRCRADQTPCHNCGKPTQGNMLRLSISAGRTNRLTPQPVCLCTQCGQHLKNQTTKH